MQDNPPPPDDNQTPREPDEQAESSQQSPEEARAPENAASPSPKEPPRPQSPQPPGNAEDTDFQAVGLDYAQRLFAGDSTSRVGDGVAPSDLPFKHEFERTKARFHKSAGRELDLERDQFTPYERGIERLRAQIPVQYQALADIDTLCGRLEENIGFVRINGDNSEKSSDRAAIIRELHNQSLIAIKVSFYTLCRIADPDDERGESSSDLPQTQSKVAEWYTKLNWFKRCYVIAACVLQGAPSHEVSRAANELHELIEQAYSPRQSAATDEQHPISQTSDGPMFVSAEDLLAHTYTVTEKYYGAERITWRDDAFDPVVREFLARQATTVGMRFGGHNLLDILEVWVVSGNEERAMRAGRMLADLWWRQHEDKVLELADAWARSADDNIWQGGAALLYGAYAAERSERPEMKAADSEVLRRLRAWADWRDDAELAQVAAYTYGLIGRQWPEVALDGLDDLLCLGASARTNNAIPPLPVVFLAMLSYMELATSGQVRPLLKRFARHATSYGQRSLKNQAVFEDVQSYRARERRLGMLFFHVVFLVALSLDGVRPGRTHASYLTNAGLLPRPDMPSSRGQDVLLAGVLAEPEREWRVNVQTLFCASIFSRREQFVFEVLATWIRIVTYEPHDDATAALVHFVVDLYRQLEDWDRKEQRSGLGSGHGVLEQRLLFWTKATQEYILRPFAQRVLDALRTS
jgi:hypothetical protein